MQNGTPNDQTAVAGWNAFRLPSWQFVRELAAEVWTNILADDCVDLAAQMSFYFVLSLFPFFLVIAGILGWLPSTNLWHNFAQWITDYFPRDARVMVFATVLNLTQGYSGFFSLGLLVTLWTSSSGFVSLMESLSVAYGVKDTRSFWKKRMIALGGTMVGAAFTVASFGLLTFGHRIEEALSLYFGAVPLVWRVARWLATLSLMILGLDLVQYFLPSGDRPWRWLTTGTAVVTLTYLATSASFNFYLRHFDSYPRLYGTLAGFIILLTWVYVSNLILLIGAETDHALEKMRRSGTSA